MNQNVTLILCYSLWEICKFISIYRIDNSITAKSDISKFPITGIVTGIAYVLYKLEQFDDTDDASTDRGIDWLFCVKGKGTQRGIVMDSDLGTR